MTPEEIEYVVVHHSASRLSTTVEQIRQWHLDKGWRDIGYHGVIESTGIFRPGRRFTETGAHVRGYNSVSVGICLVGDNTSETEKWTAPQIWTLKTILPVLTHCFPNAQVVGHLDLASTLCPGVDIREVLERE